jgi:hypothetical protein
MEQNNRLASLQMKATMPCPPLFGVHHVKHMSQGMKALEGKILASS